MCSEFQVRTKTFEIIEALGAQIKNVSKKDAWDERIKMTRPAPVIGVKGGEIRFNELIFPVRPFPNARLSQIESNRTEKKISATDDQIRRIYQVPLWKNSFEKFPCLVPMTSFYEPAYWGSHRGEIVEFSDPKETILFVPAILIKPQTPATGLFNGFSLLTHTASEQMLQFHQRLLVCLKPKFALQYLQGEFTPEERYEFLLEHRYVPRFMTSTDRKMAKGWDKRVADHEGSLVDEKKYLDILKREVAQG